MDIRSSKQLRVRSLYDNKTTPKQDSTIYFTPSNAELYESKLDYIKNFRTVNEIDWTNKIIIINNLDVVNGYTLHVYASKASNALEG